MTINEYIENRRVGLDKRIEKFNELQKIPGKSIETWKQMTEVLTYTNETLQNVMRHLATLTTRGKSTTVSPRKVQKTKDPKRMIVIPEKHSIH